MIAVSYLLWVVTAVGVFNTCYEWRHGTRRSMYIMMGVTLILAAIAVIAR
jgi:hypothetical protein